MQERPRCGGVALVADHLAEAVGGRGDADRIALCFEPLQAGREVRPGRGAVAPRTGQAAAVVLGNRPAVPVAGGFVGQRGALDGGARPAALMKRALENRQGDLPVGGARRGLRRGRDRRRRGAG